MKNLRISIGWFLMSLVALSLFLNELNDSFKTETPLIYKTVVTVLCFACIPLVVSSLQMVMVSWKERK